MYDHLARISRLVESHREYVVAVMEAHLSATSNGTNETMKILTVIATIILPMTFVAGVYRMNFRVMPELGRSWGYGFAWGVMLAVAGGVHLFLKKKRWIYLTCGISDSRLALLDSCGCPTWRRRSIPNGLTPRPGTCSNSRGRISTTGGIVRAR